MFERVEEALVASWDDLNPDEGREALTANICQWSDRDVGIGKSENRSIDWGRNGTSFVYLMPEIIHFRIFAFIQARLHLKCIFLISDLIISMYWRL